MEAVSDAAQRLHTVFHLVGCGIPIRDIDFDSCRQDSRPHRHCYIRFVFSRGARLTRYDRRQAIEVFPLALSTLWVRLQWCLEQTMVLLKSVSIADCRGTPARLVPLARI